MRKLRLSKYTAAGAICLSLLSGCGGGDVAGDEPTGPAGGMAEVTVTLSSRASDNVSRAEGDDGIPADPDNAIEKIHTWWLAFVDKSGGIKYLERAGRDAGGFETERIKATVPAGIYDVYAFANIRKPADADAFINSLSWSNGVNGNGMSGLLSAVADAPTFSGDGKLWDKSKDIVMTGYLKGVTVRNTMEESFSIEVVRSVAKVEFDFTNPTTDAITLKKLTFGRVQTGDIRLMPEYDKLGRTGYTDFGTPSYGEIEVTMNQALATTGGTHKELFYCKESKGAEEEGAFKIELTADRTKNGESAATEQKRTFYTRNIRGYINRNDWLVIPITFNEWTILWRFHYYPPIGGYPYEFDQNEEGSSLEATVGTGGEFELYPEIMKNGAAYTLSEAEWNEVGVTFTNEGFYTTTPGLLPYGTGLPGDARQFVVGGVISDTPGGESTVTVTFRLVNGDSSDVEYPCEFKIKHNS